MIEYHLLTLLADNKRFSPQTTSTWWAFA